MTTVTRSGKELMPRAQFTASRIVWFISDIAIDVQKKGPHYQARAYVIVLDEFAAAVREASVRGNWSLNGSSIGSSFSSTNDNGEAKLDSDKVQAKPGDIFTVTVIEIIKDGCIYDTSGDTSSAFVP